MTDFSEQGQRVLAIAAADACGLPELVSVMKKSCREEIFVQVKKLPVSKQQELARCFFQPFPNGEELASLVVELLNIDWLKPKQPVDIKTIEKLVEKHFQALRCQPLPVQLINRDRVAARDAAWDAARVAAYIVVSDIDSFKKQYPHNPFKSLVQLWSLGLWPMGARIIAGEEQFVVFHP